MPDEITPEAPQPSEEDVKREVIPSEAVVPISGRRPALGKLGRELLDTELAHPGVQKLLLDRLDIAETECAELRGYVERYHEVDKAAAVLRSQLSSGRAFEILCGAGFGCGGILIGIAPSLWETHFVTALVVLVVGAFFVITSIVARIVKVQP